MALSLSLRCTLALWLLQRRLPPRGGILVALLALIAAAVALVWPRPVAALPAALPMRPQTVAMVVDPTNERLYSASRWDNTVVALDGRTGQSAGALHLGAAPAALALDRTRHRLYIAENNATLLVVDTQRQTLLAALPVGSQRLAGTALPIQIAADPRTGRVYVPDFDRDRLAVLSPEQALLPPLPVGRHPVAVAVDGASDRLYVANMGDGSVSELDARSGAAIATVALGGTPTALDVDGAARRLYVGDGLAGLVTALDTRTLKVVARVPVGDFPTAVVVDPATHHVFVALLGGAGVSVLAGTRPSVVATLPVGSCPVALATDPATKRVYVARRTGKELTVLGDRLGHAVILSRSQVEPPPSPLACAGDGIAPSAAALWGAQSGPG